MLQIAPQQTILLAIKPADFRCGIDGLAALCRSQLEQDPFSGKVFVFTNKRRTAVKILVYDGQGYWLCLKRFSKGKLAWWPKDNLSAHQLLPSQLQILLYQGSPQTANIPENWRNITPLETEVENCPKLSLHNSKEAKLLGS